VLLVSGLLVLFAYSPFVTVGASPIDPANSASSSIALSILNQDYAQTSLSPIFTPEVRAWGERIIAWSAEFGLDPNLPATVMQIESCGYARALSSSGAIGLFQVMPFHFATSDSPYDPDTNARRGLTYLAQSLQKAGGDARLALAGYNGGIGVISRGEWTWSAQTKRYVYYGAPIYADASAGLTSSEILNEWYLKYGVSLCRQAHEYLGLP
jgi:soluble lytic murein transglycosylase-like protein